MCQGQKQPDGEAKKTGAKKAKRGLVGGGGRDRRESWNRPAFCSRARRACLKNKEKNRTRADNGEIPKGGENNREIQRQVDLIRDGKF